MATTDAASAATVADVVNSLDMQEVPNKLKCAICSKLAINAFKLPCCAQSICENCQTSLQGSCPVCEHSPLSPELCVPHKALRNTIKAYLKTAEKKIAEERAKAQKVVAPTSQPESVATPDLLRRPSETSEVNHEESQAVDEKTLASSIDGGNLDIAETTSIAPDEPQPSIETNEEPDPFHTNGNKVRADSFAADITDPSAPTSGDATGADTEASRTASAVPESTKSFDMQQNGMGFGMNDPNMQNMMNMPMGGGGNMDFSQMMQFMPNGMMNGMGMNNMMGMPGAGMNPMSQQGMFGAFGQGMGMNQMNGMNMGFPPSGGQGMFGGGWNGQNNMWNGQQNGMGAGFASNAGFGYNMNHQGNFQQNQYPYNDFQHGYRGQGYPRGRGRGRGAFGWSGRGGYGPNMQGDHSNYQQNYQQLQHQPPYSQQGQSMTNGDYVNGQVENSSSLTEDQLKQIDDGLAPGGQEETNEALGISSDPSGITIDGQPSDQPNDESAVKAKDESSKPSHGDEGDTSHAKDLTNPDIMDETGAQSLSSIPVAPMSDITDNPDIGTSPAPRNMVSMPPPTAPLGPAAQFGYGHQNFGFRGRGYGRFATRGRGGYGPGAGYPPFNAPTEPRGQGVPGAPTGPKGAPTGPKAMRQDVSAPPSGPRSASINANTATNANTNTTSESNGNDTNNDGLQIIGRASMATQDTKTEENKSEYAENKYEEDQRDQEEYPEESGSRARSRTRSPSRHRSRKHRRYHDSRDVSEAEYESSTRKSQKGRSSRHENDTEYGMNGEDNGHVSDSSRKESRRHRDRERHSKSKHSSSHRSRRHDHDSHEDYPEDRDSTYESKSKIKDSSNLETESRASSHRDHKDRDRDRERERERERERDRDRDRDRDRSSKYESSRREDRHRDKKRSRRDREEEVEDDYDPNLRHRSRRQRREDRDDGNDSRRSLPTPAPEPEKDPHTLEREARNRERMLKEQQRREAAMNAEKGNKGRKDSRHDRGLGGRRLSYKYEDEADAARGEHERESARWR